MESKEKLFNIEIFKLIFRKVGWIGVVFQVFLLGAVAFPLFIQAMDYKNMPDYSGLYHESLFAVASEVQIIIIFFVPLILGLFLYSFLMNKRTAVFMHSLPVSRKSSYLHHTLSSVVLLIVPIIITMFVSLIIVETSVMPKEVKDCYVYLDWILIASSVSLLMFSLSTFIAMITGNFRIQGALTVGVLAAPFILFLGVKTFCMRLFYSYYFIMPTIDGSFQESIYQLSSILMLISLFILVLSYFIYLKRDIENSSTSIVFKPLRPVFKYGLTILFGLSMSIVMAGFATSTSVFFIALVIGSFIGYCIAVFVLKGLKIYLKDFIGFLIVLVVFTVTFVGAIYYSSIYEDKIPGVSEISSVTIGTNGYLSSYYEYTDYSEFKEEVEAVGVLTDAESFEVITEIHQEFIDAKPAFYDPSAVYYGGFTITYTLNDGSEFSRIYYNTEGAPEIFEKVAAMPEVVQNYCEFLDTTVRSEASWFFIYDKNGEWTGKIEGDAISGFVDALIADIEEVGLVPYNESTVDPDKRYIGYQIEFIPGTVRVNAVISEDYVNTIKWLEENGYEE